MSLPQGRFTFALLHNLGAGGFGIVDAVRVTESNCAHAVGTMLARKKLNDKFRQHPESQERFEREIAAVDKLHHAGIVGLEGVNVPGEERAYFMLLFAQSLRQLLSSKEGASGFPWHQVALFGASLANALAYAHAQGIVHRDLKPENILLDENRQPFITDWGVGHFMHRHSKVLQPALTKAGIGTEFYSSLEQWHTGAGSATSDVYSLGVLLAELALGAPPAMTFAGAGIAFDVVRSASSGAGLFNEMIRDMTSMLAKDRPQTMIEVELTLRQCAALDRLSKAG